MGKIIDSMLQPKRLGLTGKNKPSVIILSSPYDKVTTAVRYSVVSRVAEERGYSILNKRAILNGHDVTIRSGDIKPCQSKKRELTIWLESHGAPGWLFSKENSVTEEIIATLQFAKYLRDIETTTGLKINSIMLSCCFSANEYVSKDQTTYFISPARLLSKMIPGCNVMGFIGQNTTAKVTGVFRMLPSETTEPVIAKLESMAVVFRDGRVVELPEENLYCDHSYTPSTLVSACKIDITTLYQPAAAIAAIDQLIHTDEEVTGVPYAIITYRHLLGARHVVDEGYASSAEDGKIGARRHSFFSYDVSRKHSTQDDEVHLSDAVEGDLDACGESAQLTHSDSKVGYLRLKGIRSSPSF